MDSSKRAKAEYIADMASQLAAQAHELGLTAAEFCLRMAAVETFRIATGEVQRDEQSIHLTRRC